jgi:hypothetical protein
MMNYRLYIADDEEAVRQLCEDNLIAFPSENNLLFVAEDKGEIIGICGAKTDYRIEPLIATNPIAANNLARMVEGALLATGVKRTIAFVNSDNVKHIEQLVKAGYEIIENKTILEKHHG